MPQDPPPRGPPETEDPSRVNRTAPPVPPPPGSLPVFDTVSAYLLADACLDEKCSVLKYAAAGRGLSRLISGIPYLRELLFIHKSNVSVSFTYLRSLGAPRVRFLGNIF